VLRDLVWDRLHGRSRPAPPRDVDLAFFDPARLDRARDAEVEAALAARLPGIPGDAKNQAAVHTWYARVFGGQEGQVAPLRSAADGDATWPETATAVAVHLDAHDRLEVVAPYGLEDLFNLVCRRNPRRVTVDHDHRRVRDKRIASGGPGCGSCCGGRPATRGAAFNSGGRDLAPRRGESSPESGSVVALVHRPRRIEDARRQGGGGHERAGIPRRG
jgi:uncharacterized protein